MQARFLAAAAAIADRIRAAAVERRDGSIAWSNPHAKTSGEVLGPHLYDGTVGMAMFLAALDFVRRDSEHRELALRSLAPLRRKLQDMAASPEEAAGIRMGIGGLVGLGSFLYGLRRVGIWLEEPRLVHEASALKSLMTPERIAGDVRLDVVSGSAGALLALLADDGSVPECLELADACADHLLQRRVPADGGHRGWPWSGGPQTVCLGGFAHGAAGICHALLRLYERTGSQELWDAAQEGLSLERLLYSPEHRNWRDARFPDLRFMVTWCHGAPGIGLGRLGTLAVADDPRIREEIGIAIQTTLAQGLTEVDHLCCGNMGRAEILLYAHRRLGDPVLLHEARTLASEVLQRAEAGGSFRLSPQGGRAPDPSFFRGLAGIGYAFLRQAEPSLPCVLLLE